MIVLGQVAATREQLLLQTQKLASRRSEKPPKLPPRDNIYHPHDIPKPDYDDINEDDRLKAFRVKSDKGRDLNKKYGIFDSIIYFINNPFEILTLKTVAETQTA